MTSFAADRARRTTETDRWLAGMLGAEPGVALVAVGGYGRRELLPGSDLDVLLLHAGRDGIASIADRIWYPVWDSGARLDHAVRTVPQARRVARADIKVALGLLSARHVAGDPALTTQLREGALEDWRAARPDQAGRTARSAQRAGQDLRRAGVPARTRPQGGQGRAAGRARDPGHRGRLGRLGAGPPGSRRVRIDPRRPAHPARDHRPRLRPAGPRRARRGGPGRGAAGRRRAAARAGGSRADGGVRRRPRFPAGRTGRSRRLRRRKLERRPLADGVVEQDGEVVLARAADPASDPALVLRAAAAAAQAGRPLAPGPCPGWRSARRFRCPGPRRPATR